MNIKNLWVGNVYNCFFSDEMELFITKPGQKVVGCILKRISEFSYQSLSNGIIYTTQNDFGLNKVDARSIKPLSAYYTTCFKIKRKDIINSEVVHNNVKKLRKAKKI